MTSSGSLSVGLVVIWSGLLVIVLVLLKGRPLPEPRTNKYWFPVAGTFGYAVWVGVVAISSIVAGAALNAQFHSGRGWDLNNPPGIVFLLSVLLVILLGLGYWLVRGILTGYWGGR